MTHTVLIGLGILIVVLTVVSIFGILPPLRIVPDWVCEIVSPSTAQVDRHHKLPLYVASGVAHVWLVDPEARLVEVYAASDGKPLLVASLAEAEIAVLPPFGIEIAVERLWLPREEAAGEQQP